MADDMKEVGVSGLKAQGGIVTEEWLADLRGKPGRTKFREMADNDPIIGGMMRGITEIVARLDWHLEAPDNATPQEEEAAQFVEECRTDMSTSWDSVIGDILSMGVYGWAFLEVVYKRRVGPYELDPMNRSKFTDGRIGWRKWALRSQDTLEKWDIDPAGGIQAMIQSTENGRFTIPIERALLFRTDEQKNNPEGRSLLRNAYRPWFFRKRIEEFEAIGIERDLAGLPVIYAPASWYSKEATKEERDSLEALKGIVKDLRRNDAEGVLLPSIYSEDGTAQLLKLELLTTGGTRQFDTSAIIQRYTTQIASSLLMDFLTLGHEGTGSYALGAAKIELWHLTIEALAKSVAAVVNAHAIPRLLMLNGITVERMPELRFGDIAQADLTVLGKFLTDMVDRGLIEPDEDLEDWIRTIARMPARSVTSAGPSAASIDDPAPDPTPAAPPDGVDPEDPAAVA